jgi:carboxymethylenebutenolidase
MCDLEGCGAHKEMPPIVIPDEDRRAFLKGLVALPLAAVLFEPVLARAQADRMEMASIPVPGAAAPATGALALPDADNAPAVLLIHEWWGLNDQIKAVAAEFAKAGFIAFAIDLFDSEPATTGEGAMALIQGLDSEVATAKLVAAVEWLRNHPQGNGKVGTVGWCFGGNWSLDTSLATPVDATVIYYGNVAKSAAELAALRGPVLGHFGTEDRNINEAMVSGFQEEMIAAGKDGSLTVNWYTTDHGFANPTSARYDADDTRLAWDRTLEFLRAHLG